MTRIKLYNGTTLELIASFLSNSAIPAIGEKFCYHKNEDYISCGIIVDKISYLILPTNDNDEAEHVIHLYVGEQ